MLQAPEPSHVVDFLIDIKQKAFKSGRSLPIRDSGGKTFVQGILYVGADGIVLRLVGASRKLIGWKCDLDIDTNIVGLRIEGAIG